MRVIRNQAMVRQLSDNIVANEMSNIAMVLQSPSILVTWFAIDPDLSETVRGYKNVDDFIHPDSPVVYNRIEHLPMYGIDNLVMQSQFEDEIAGYDEDYTSAGVIYPNTIFPKPNDCFIIENSQMPALFMVTDIKPTTVRSNPFIEITFRLKSRDPRTIAQIQRQVREEYVTAMSSIGLNKSLVITKSAQKSIEDHVNAYLEISALYTMLFYDRNKSAFVFDGIPGPDDETKTCYIDMTLWRFMFDEGIVIFDDIVTYANSNLARGVDRIYTGCPDVYIEDYAYQRSIINRIYNRDSTPAVRQRQFDEYRYPEAYEGPSQITKYQGRNIWILEKYHNEPEITNVYGDFYIWDDEFLCRIRNNDPYPEISPRYSICAGCQKHCAGAPVLCYNPFLRNVIIRWFNGVEIDWDSVEIADERTVENYYLIPMMLGIYKRFIQGLQ